MSLIHTYDLHDMSSILRGILSNHIALHGPVLQRDRPSDPFPPAAEISGALCPPGFFGVKKSVETKTKSS